MAITGTKAEAGLLKVIARAHELQEIFTRRRPADIRDGGGRGHAPLLRHPDAEPAGARTRTRAPIDWQEQRAGLGFI